VPSGLGGTGFVGLGSTKSLPSGRENSGNLRMDGADRVRGGERDGNE